MNQQNWRWGSDGTIRSAIGGYTKCIDVPGGNLENAPNVWLWDCNGGDSQKWGWTDYHPGVIAPGQDGVIYYLTKGEWSYCIDIPGGDPSAKNGVPLIMWPCSHDKQPGEPFQLVRRSTAYKTSLNNTISPSVLV